jgi:hypothetical protein
MLIKIKSHTATKLNRVCDAFWIAWYWCAWRYVVRISSSIFLARGIVLSRGYTKMRLHGTIPMGEWGSKCVMANWRLPHCSLLVSMGRLFEWYAKRGQPENVERISWNDWVVWLPFWPMDWSLELSNRSLIFVERLDLDIAGRFSCNESWW